MVAARGRIMLVAMRLLTLRIDEPLAGRVFTAMADEVGAEEAARRYRAVVVTTLRQLRGLVEARLRLMVTPEDGADAVRFWLLPRLAGAWDADGGVYRADGWEIEFGGGDEGPYRVLAEGEALCPMLGARWVHAAWLGIERGSHCVRGVATGGGDYFHARPGGQQVPDDERALPDLPVIRSDHDWNEALASGIGPALKKAWERE